MLDVEQLSPRSWQLPGSLGPTVRKRAREDVGEGRPAKRSFAAPPDAVGQKRVRELSDGPVGRRWAKRARLSWAHGCETRRPYRKRKRPGQDVILFDDALAERMDEDGFPTNPHKRFRPTENEERALMLYYRPDAGVREDAYTADRVPRYCSDVVDRLFTYDAVSTIPRPVPERKLDAITYEPEGVPSLWTTQDALGSGMDTDMPDMIDCID
mmetsp:Transcript_21070/g.59274  ORF Transcript_21070/g.59274 Transcript_21070/m.59274 type:complete len:212 (+) Transcript_21070:135-770(+)